MTTRHLLTAGAAALAATAAVAATGSAQSPGPQTLHLVAHSDPHVGFFPKARPRQGDRLGFGDRISGDRSGIDRAACTIVDRGLLCTIQVRLSDGTLSAQGIIPQRSKDTPVAITGGTGAYDGARGTATVTDTSQTRSRITVSLLP